MRQASVSETLGETIMTDGAVLIPRFCSVETAIGVRDAIHEWGLATPPLLHGVAMQDISPDLNYHRIDGDPSKSSAPHIHHNFTFNRFDFLTDDFRRKLLSIYEPMRALQNKVTGHIAHFSPTRERRKLRPQVLHYPSGGGFFSAHKHELEPQRIGLVLALSRRCIDHTTGSFRILLNGRWEDMNEHDAGDLILFRFDVPHEVTPVDNEKKIDWASASGRWTMVLPYY